MSEQWAAPGPAAEERGAEVGERAVEVRYEPAQAGSALIWARSIAVMLVAVVWVFVVLRLVGLHGDVQELTDDFFDDASAMQVSQVANQAMVEQLLYLGVGFAATAVGVMFCLAAQRD